MIYIALLLWIVVHPKRFIIMGGLSSTTTSEQPPLGWCYGCHSTTAPERSPHTSYRESYRVNQGDGDYWEAMMVRGQWREIVLDTGVTPLLFTRSPMGFLMTTESQDLGLTSHPKDGNLHISWHENIARTCPNRSSSNLLISLEGILQFFGKQALFANLRKYRFKTL